MVMREETGKLEWDYYFVVCWEKWNWLGFKSFFRFDKEFPLIFSLSWWIFESWTYMSLMPIFWSVGDSEIWNWGTSLSSTGKMFKWIFPCKCESRQHELCHTFSIWFVFFFNLKYKGRVEKNVSHVGDRKCVCVWGGNSKNQNVINLEYFQKYKS